MCSRDFSIVREEGKITVFLLDDHEVVRRGVHDCFGEGDIEVVGEAGTAADAPGTVRRPAPTSPSSTCGCRTAAGSRCAGRSARATRRSSA